MSEVKSVMDFAEKQGYESAYLVLKWKGYDVYQPVYSDEMSYIGLPLMILVKGEKIRMTTPDEAFEIFDIMKDVDDNNFVGDEYIIEDWDKEHLVERVKGMFHKWFGRKNTYSKEQEKARKSVIGTKVVDGNGEPVVVYHTKKKGLVANDRFYFTEDKKIADSYKRNDDFETLVGYIDAKNMIEFDFKGKPFSMYGDSLKKTDEIIDEVKKDGRYDVVKFSNILDIGPRLTKDTKDIQKSNEYVIFNPAQFKMFKKE